MPGLVLSINQRLILLFVWQHKRESKCVTIPLDRPISRRDYIQNVSTGNHSDCPKLTNSIISNSIPSEQHKSTSKAIDSTGSQTINILSDNGQSNKEVIIKLLACNLSLILALNAVTFSPR